LNLEVINWILARIFTIAVVAILIIFQPELRRGLARLGQSSIFGAFARESKVIDEIIKAAVNLSSKKIGAIIALEREMGLKTYIESGVPIGAKVKSELINTIFMPNTPLHDGGLIIRENRIQAAGCLFPLTESPHVSKTLGTRHRAALGLSEETDAVVLVVSEETGTISLAVAGKLIRSLDKDTLKRSLDKLYGPEKRMKPLSRQFIEQEEINEEAVS
jgi:diadenylate cyclase